MGGICDRGSRDGAASAARAAGLLGISGDDVFDPGFCPCPGTGEYMEKTCLLKAAFGNMKVADNSEKEAKTSDE